MTGLRHCTRGLSFLNESKIAGRISAGSKMEDVDLALILERPSGLHEEMLDDGSERKHGEKRQRPDDQYDRDQKHGEDRAVGRKGTARWRRDFLLSKAAGYRKHGHDDRKTANEHVDRKHVIVPIGIGIQPGESAAVVGRRRSKRI